MRKKKERDREDERMGERERGEEGGGWFEKERGKHENPHKIY